MHIPGCGALTIKKATDRRGLGGMNAAGTQWVPRGVLNVGVHCSVSVLLLGKRRFPAGERMR